MNDSSSTSKPEVSVLMSCYNSGRWLKESIESVLSQTYEKYEFIIVNDGSTDDTWEIIRSYQEKDKRIIAISKKKSGLTESLNVGLIKARGSWIARLDADDISEPTRLEEQFDFVRNHPEVVLLGTGCIEIDEIGRPIKKHLYPTEHSVLVRHLDRSKKIFTHSSVFYRKDIVLQAGGYNIHYKSAQDWPLWLELSLRGKLACLKKHLVRIRKHPGQMSNDKKGKLQICEKMAASICLLIRKDGGGDISLTKEEDEWNKFIKWIEDWMEKLGVFERHIFWQNTRGEFYMADNRVIRGLRFAKRLMQSRQTKELLWEKFFGSSIPHLLAREWIKQIGSVSRSI